MKVFIDKAVEQSIETFYQASLLLHETLTFETVERKVNRLYDAIQSLETYAHIYRRARLKKEWIKAGYREFICEDFHFAYEICQDENGIEYVRVRDAVHSLLYYE